jgi:hypothetical protein
MSYKAMETLVSPDVPDEINEFYHPSRPGLNWRLKAVSSAGAFLGSVAVLSTQGAFALSSLPGIWKAVDLASIGLDIAVVGIVVWRRRSRDRRTDRQWGHRIISTAAQSTYNPDSATRLAALDQLIHRFRTGYRALAKVGYEPVGITARTADDLHYALAAPIINSFALRDLLIGGDAHRAELADEVAAARSELSALNAAFDSGYAAITELCNQIDGIRQQIELAAARQRLRNALAAADLPATPAVDSPDIESMSATASAMVEFLRTSLA